MKFKSAEEIRACLEPIAAEQGLTVCAVEFKNSDEPSLTVFIDKAGGVDLDACERFHNAIDAPLDELDPSYGEGYTLNVSSLGADRPFVTEEDFARHIGQKVEVKLASSVKGKKVFRGRTRLLRRQDAPREGQRERNAHFRHEIGQKGERSDRILI